MLDPENRQMYAAKRLFFFSFLGGGETVDDVTMRFIKPFSFALSHILSFARFLSLARTLSFSRFLADNMYNIYTYISVYVCVCVYTFFHLNQFFSNR